MSPPKRFPYHHEVEAIENIVSQLYPFHILSTVLDLVMIAPIQLQCILSYTVLSNPELEPHVRNTYQSKLVPCCFINSNKCEF